MDRYLKDGSRIKNPARSGEYEISGIIGTGASCVVYLADFLESSGARTEHLLKEYNPKAIRIERDDHGILRVSDEKDHAAFEAGLQRFEAGYQMQLNVRRCSDMKNSTSNIQSIFEVNGTRYIDMTVMEGYTYDQVQEDSLYDLLRRIKTITEVIADYHKNGLLHLDIKPENILALPETVEMVQMFDYDSVTPKKDVIHSAFLSYTQSWAAQEQILPNRRNRICEATDLFAIGEILFYKLMGRHSESHERRSFASYRFDYSADIFAGVNPRAFGLLEDIFRHTICNKCADRYQSATELLRKLTDTIELADPRKLFLQHHLPSKSSYFVGRDAQLQEIADRLQRTDKLFISGMGGMGKSELVKQYAHVYQDAYDAVIFAVCNTDLESMILDDSMLPIGNVQQWPDEKAQEYYARKLKELKKLCNKRILIIVDNFNNLQDEALDALLRLNCKMLFTTRCDVTEYNYAQMELGTMAEKFVWDLFCTWYGRRPVDEERMYARQIIDLYQGHTMAVELIAKQMKASHISPKQMLDKLGTGGFRTSGRERVIHVKDGMHPKLNIHDHIRRLFNVLELNDEQVYILANLSLMPPSGVSAELFHDWCKLDGYEDINELAESGWLRQDPEADLISLHPVIADVMLEELEADSELCIPAVRALNEYLRHDLACADADSRHRFTMIIRAICDKLIKFEDFPFASVEFLNLCSSYFTIHSKSRKWIRYLKKACQVYRLHIQKVDGYALVMFANMGLLYHENGNLKQAEQYYKRVLKESVFVGDEVETVVATTYNNLATLYMDIEKWKHAEEMLKKAISIKESLPDEPPVGIATLYDNLGTVYQELEQYPKAVSAYEKAQEILHLCGYGRSEDQAINYEHLGDLYSEMVDYVQAEEYMIKALDLWRTCFGENSIDTANAYRALGLLYRNTARYDKAIEHLTASLNINKATGNDALEGAAKAHSALGKTYVELGDFDSAETCYRQALSIRSRLYAQDDESIQLVLERMDELQKLRQQKNS